MRGESGIRELRSELLQMIQFIEDFGTDEESESTEVDFAGDVVDTLSWVLAEISNKEFRDDPYLNIPQLQKTVKDIEERTGEILQDHL